MSWSDALLNRALDVASAPWFMDRMSRVSARRSQRRRARYQRARDQMADLGVATRVDLLKALAESARLTDEARALAAHLVQAKRSRRAG